jgi:hypothetical protein
MTDQHRATPEQWAKCEEDARLWSGAFNCILELRARIEALEQRLTPPMAEAAADPAPASEPPPQIASSQELYQIWDSSTNVSSALRAVYDLGHQHGAAQAVCPHIVSTDEGTSYCRLAEQGAAPITPVDEPRAASAEGQPAASEIFPVEYADANGEGIRIIMEPADETGRVCWVVRNSRRVNPIYEFPTPEAAYAAHQARAEDEGNHD